MRMQDKVMQIVTDGARVLRDNAVIRNVWLRAGKMYGKFEGQNVVSTSSGIWMVQQ